MKTWIIKGKGQHGGTVQITIANTLTAEQMVDRILPEISEHSADSLHCAGYPHFYAADNPYDCAELGTETNENGIPIPYIFGALCNGGKKIYLNECERW